MSVCMYMCFDLLHAQPRSFYHIYRGYGTGQTRVTPRKLYNNNKNIVIAMMIITNVCYSNTPNGVRISALFLYAV